MKTPRVAKKPQRPRAVPEDQRYFWTAEWQRGEREASAEDLHRRHG